MDANKKFLYFNADSSATNGTEVSATTVPVSTFCGMEVTSTGNFSMLFKESVETDTLDVAMSRTNNSDPRGIMERIVNEINFSKDSLLVVGDNSTSQFIDENLSGLTLSFADHTFIKLANHLAVHQGTAEDPGDGFDTGTYSVDTGSVGMINGEVITTLFIDLGDSAATCASSTDKVIGKDSAIANASVTKITEAKNGVVYRAELICVETASGTGNVTKHIDVYATTDDLTTDDAVTGDQLLIPAGALDKGDVVRSTTGSAVSFHGMADHFVYLATGTAPGGSGGTFTAGKFILRLFGAPTTSLTDIS